MRRLVAQLAAYAKRTDDGVAVVFDGPARDLGEHGVVEVAFATRAGRDAADDDIVIRAEHDPDPAGLTVVTSDATLADRIRATGAAVEGADAFLRRLESD